MSTKAAFAGFAETKTANVGKARQIRLMVIVKVMVMVMVMVGVLTNTYMHL